MEDVSIEVVFWGVSLKGVTSRTWPQAPSAFTQLVVMAKLYHYWWTFHFWMIIVLVTSTLLAKSVYYFMLYYGTEFLHYYHCHITMGYFIFSSEFFYQQFCQFSVFDGLSFCFIFSDYDNLVMPCLACLNVQIKINAFSIYVMVWVSAGST